MKALLIGGTGTISSAVTERALASGWELTILNRGNRGVPLPPGCHSIQGDMEDESNIKKLLEGKCFDVVADFIVFTPEQLKRDLRLFRDKTDQYIFVSSATVYRKPPTRFPVTEDCPLGNPYWAYAQRKIQCEEVLTRAGREEGFPYTIVRPSHTYGNNIPVAVHGGQGSWQVVERIRSGKPVVVHGDGTTLWTLTHSSDFAKAFVGLMGNPHALGEHVHITSDEAVTWNEIIGQLGRILGVEPKPVHIATDYLAAWDDAGYDLRGGLLGDKAYNAVFDNSKVKRLVPEFVCTTPIHRGFRQALAYLDAHPEQQRPDPVFDDWCERVIARYQSGLPK